MGVSENSGTPKSSIFNRVFHYKPSILGYPYFWKHPYIDLNFSCRTELFPERGDRRRKIPIWPALNLQSDHGFENTSTLTPWKFTFFEPKNHPFCKGKASEPNLHDIVFHPLICPGCTSIFEKAHQICKSLDEWNQPWLDCSLGTCKPWAVQLPGAVQLP